MSARMAVVFACASLCAACGDAPSSNQTPAPSPADPFIGTWTRNGAATFEASRVHLERVTERSPEAERAALIEAAREELVDSPWTLVVAADGTLVLDAVTRTPGAGVLEPHHFTGTWTRTDANVVLEVDTTRPGAEAEITQLTGTLALEPTGDRLTFGGPPGSPRGLVLEFERARD